MSDLVVEMESEMVDFDRRRMRTSGQGRRPLCIPRHSLGENRVARRK